jgi:hypothetical protein
LAGLGIFLFRKYGTAPSDNFRNRLRESYPPPPSNVPVSRDSYASSTTPLQPQIIPQYATYETVENIPLQNMNGKAVVDPSGQYYNQQTNSYGYGQQYSDYNRQNRYPDQYGSSYYRPNAKPAQGANYAPYGRAGSNTNLDGST